MKKILIALICATAILGMPACKKKAKKPKTTKVDKKTKTTKKAHKNGATPKTRK